MYQSFSRSVISMVFGLTLLTASTLTSAVADSNSAHFQVNQTLSDGKQGRPWAQWRQAIANQGVQRVEAIIRNTQGHRTYVNLRFEGGNAFENGRQVFLPGTDIKRVSWNVNGESPNGRGLVLNAYDGIVQLQAVTVYYSGSTVPRNNRPHTTGSVKSYPKRHPSPRPRNDGRFGNQPTYGNDDLAYRRCRNLGRTRRPRIEVGRARSSGGLFSGKYRINGSIVGTCIEEAGYFEQGRLKQAFDVPLSDRFQRKDFSIQVRGGRDGEIRVYDINGREDIIYVDEIIRDNQ